MADGNTVDSLQIEIEAASSEAEKKVDALAAALERLKKTTTGFGSVSSRIKNIGSSADKTAAGAKIRKQREAIQRAAESITPKNSETEQVESEASLQKKLGIIQRIADTISSITGKKIDIASAGGLKNLLGKDLSLQNIIPKGIGGALGKAGDAFKGLTDKGLAFASAHPVIAAALVGLKSAGQTLWNGLKGLAKFSFSALKKSFEVVTGAAKKLASALGNLVRAGISKAAAGLKSLAKSIGSRFTAPFRKAIEQVSRWKKMLGSAIFYSTVFRGMSIISNGLKEGIKNLYEYSKLVGTEFAPAMNSLATSALYLKNSLGAMAAPMIQALAPAIDFLIDKFVALINVIGKAFAMLAGKSVYTQAKKHAVEYGEAANNAAKATQKFLLGIDELTILENPAGGAGSALEDYGSMFEEVEIDQDQFDWVKQIREAIEKGEWRSVGELVADKLNEIVDSWDSYAWGKKLGELINNGLNVAYGFLKKFDFENLGLKVADFFNGIFDSVDWDLAGRTFAAGWNGLMEFIYGLITGFHWDTFGKAIADAIIGFFSEIDWELPIKILQAGIEAVRQAFVGFLSEFGEKLDIKGITDPLIEIVNTVSDTLQTVIDLTVEWAKNLDFTPILNAFEGLLAAIAPLVETISNGLLWAYENVLLPLATWTIEEAIPATINFFSEAFTKLNEALNQIDFEPVIEAFQRLLESISPLVEIVSDGLLWAYENVLLPFGTWTIEEALPTAINLLATGFEFLTEIFEKLSPVAKFLWDDILQPIFGAAWDVLSTAVDAVSNSFQKLTDLLRGNTSFSEFIDSLAPGEALILGIATALGVAATAFVTIKTAVAAFNVVATTLKVVLTAVTSPIGLVVTAVGLLVAGFVELYKHSEGFRKFIDDVVEGAKNLIPGIIEGIREGWNNLTEFLGGIWDSIVQGFKNFFGIHSPSTVFSDLGGNLIAGLLGGISESWEGIVEFFGEKLGALKESISKKWDEMKQAASEKWENIKTTLGTTWDNIKASASEKFSSIKENISEKWENVKKDTSEKWENVKTTLSDAWENMKTTASEKVSEIKENVSSKWSDIVSSAASWGSDLCSNLASGINKGISWVTNAVSSVANSVKSFLHFSEPDIGPLSDFHTYMPDMMSLMSKGIKDNAYKAIDAANDVARSMSMALGDIEPVEPKFTAHENILASINPEFGSGRDATANVATDDGQSQNSLEIVNAIFAIGQQIVTAISENGDRPINLDWASMASGMTTMQNRQNMMYGRTLQNA